MAFIEYLGELKSENDEKTEATEEEKEEKCDDEEEISNIKEKNSASKKDIFRPYNLPDPDIKPLTSSYNVSDNDSES